MKKWFGVETLEQVATLAKQHSKRIAEGHKETLSDQFRLIVAAFRAGVSHAGHSFVNPETTRVIDNLLKEREEYWAAHAYGVFFVGMWIDFIYAFHLENLKKTAEALQNK